MRNLLLLCALLTFTAACGDDHSTTTSSEAVTLPGDYVGYYTLDEHTTMSGPGWTWSYQTGGTAQVYRYLNGAYYVDRQHAQDFGGVGAVFALAPIYIGGYYVMQAYAAQSNYWVGGDNTAKLNSTVINGNSYLTYQLSPTGTVPPYDKWVITGASGKTSGGANWQITGYMYPRQCCD